MRWIGSESRSRFTEALHFLSSYFSSQPSYCIFFVTARCNARCQHCFYWEEIASANPKTELNLEEIEAISKGLKLIYLSVGGGEPFLRKDLPQIIHLFYHYSGLLYGNIVTNGFDPKRITTATKEILRLCPRLKLKVQVSIDDFENAHDTNRQITGLYRQAIESLKQLSLIRKKHPRLTLDIATCLTSQNKHHVYELETHLRKELKFDNYSFLYPRGAAFDPKTKQVGPEEYESAITYLERQVPKRTHNSILGSVQRIARRGILEIIKHNAYPWPCLAGKKFIHISEKGVLHPCEILNQLNPPFDCQMGSLDEHGYDIPSLLKSSQARKVKTYIKQSKCRCSFECAAMNNVVFKKSRALSVLKDWMMTHR